MELFEVNFTGAGSHTLRACLDKAVTKGSAHEIWRYSHQFMMLFYLGDQLWTKCRYPVIVKPVHEDGSIGISNKSIATIWMN